VGAAEGGAELDAQISSRRRADVEETAISSAIEAEKALRRGDTAAIRCLVQVSYTYLHVLR
jgi:hypothetical protein